MSFEQTTLMEEKIKKLFDLEENYFYDFKSKDILPAKLSKTVSAFANSSGGEIYLGIREERKSKIKHWEGFQYIEDFNSHIAVLEQLSPISNFYDLVFLKHPVLKTYVLQITVMKSNAIIKATDGLPYVRKGAQNLPVNTADALRRLELDKGITSFENEFISETSLSDLNDSETLKIFVESVVPQRQGISWIKKQHLCNDEHLSVAGALLFLDEPQIFLPKQSAIKVYRYKTSGLADRDMLDGSPITIEGCAYNQIYDAVSRVKEIIEGIKKLGHGFENIQYPEETLHEIITNAVLHRDYSIITDIQIRIFDNRVEIESPGKLPGHVTVENILDSQAARNPKLVRIINKFPKPPNKDVGEGLNTAFDAMAKLRLKNPEIVEKDTSVLVVIKHEKLASPEEIVMEYLKTHNTIVNHIGRQITGIKSENSMKTVFYHLRDQGYIKLIHGKNIWIKNEASNTK